MNFVDCPKETPVLVYVSKLSHVGLVLQLDV